MGDAWTVVGVDCATREERTGLSRGIVDANGELTIVRATLGTAGESAAATVAGWIRDAGPRYVLAMDAPLGWPAALGAALAPHRAGQAIAAPADALFRRDTDRFVHEELGKVPLEVGADRIARTARAALGLLEAVRELTGEPLPMAWQPGVDAGVIEVYPAATLLSRGISISGYKADTPAGRDARAGVFTRLREHLVTSIRPELVMENGDLLDAVVCVLAGADFARDQAIPPRETERAMKEGWIWFRGRGQRTLF